jgi:hypothetical protein
MMALRVYKPEERYHKIATMTQQNEPKPHIIGLSLVDLTTRFGHGYI